MPLQYRAGRLPWRPAMAHEHQWRLFQLSAEPSRSTQPKNFGWTQLQVALRDGDCTCGTRRAQRKSRSAVNAAAFDVCFDKRLLLKFQNPLAINSLQACAGGEGVCLNSIHPRPIKSKNLF